MESNIKIKTTPRDMGKFFNNSGNNGWYVKSYSFLGIEKEGDFDCEKCSDKEWDELADTTCLYEVRIRHATLKKYLSETHVYASWRGVGRAITRREFDE